MKILFAASDRDLLECYRVILSEAFGETVTAFDGTQALSLLSEQSFDAAVIDSDLPRVDHKLIVKRLNEKNIPVTVLTGKPVTVGLLSGDPLANSYMLYPFSPDEIIDNIKEVCAKASSDEKLSFADIEVDVSGFRINNGARLTSKEIDVLKAAAIGGNFNMNSRSSISALNGKLAAVGSRARIKYRSEEGFKLVMENE